MREEMGLWQFISIVFGGSFAVAILLLFLSVPAAWVLMKWFNLFFGSLQ